MGSRLIRWHYALAVSAIFGIVMALLVRVTHDASLRNMIVTGANFLASCVAIYWVFTCLRAAGTGRYRRSWAFIFLSLITFILGEIYWTHNVLSWHTIPPLSWNDLFFLVSYLLLGLGLLLHYGQTSNERLEKLIYATDIVILLGATVSIAVQLSFPSLITAEGATLLSLIQGLAYPVVALGILICICLMLRQAVPRILEAPRALLVLGIGLLLGGTWLAYLILNGADMPVYLCQSLWSVGFLLCAIAALWEGDVYQQSAGQPFEVDPLPTVSSLLVSMTLVLGAMLLSIRGYANPDTLEPKHMFFALISLAVLIALVLVRQLLTFERNRALYRTLNELYAQMSWNAATDPLTGIVNHGYFMERLEIELQRSQRYGRSLALLFLDLDHFKLVNDTYGHHIGDEVLKAFARTLQNGVRECDLVGRYGGEEFIVLLPETELDQARNLALRLRQALTTMELPDASMSPVTMSCGIAAYPGNADTMEALLAEADRAMYRAKEAGRDRVVTAGPPASYLFIANR